MRSSIPPPNIPFILYTPPILFIPVKRLPPPQCEYECAQGIPPPDIPFILYIPPILFIPVKRLPHLKVSTSALKASLDTI